MLFRSVFYYGGHGFQLGKENYLVPVDAALRDRTAIAVETVQLNRIISLLLAPKRRTVILLDACRNNPLPKKLRDRAGPQGLAEIGTGGGDLFVAFATEPGKLALDGKGRNSPFAKALLTHMTRPGLSISEMMVDLRKDVYASTQGVQLPWDQSSLRSQFYFSPMISVTESLASRTQNGIPDEEAEPSYIITDAPGEEPAPEPVAKAKPEPIFGAENEPAVKPKEQIKKSAPEPVVSVVVEPLQQQPAIPAEPEPEPEVAVLAPPPPPAVETPEVSDDGSFTDCAGHCPAMVNIPAGRFAMGSGEGKEGPVHEVSVGAFALSRNEVTVVQWQACVAASKCRDPGAAVTGGGADLPVRNLTWDDAMAYAAWLSEVTGEAYRLPSEAEWEYAARAGTSHSYSGSAEASLDYVDCKDCGGAHKAPAPRGDLLPNGFGLSGMSGGVADWVMDCWKPSYADAPTDGGARGGTCTQRVLRGGSWRDNQKHVRVTSRAFYDHDVPYPNNGLRIARDARN